MKEGMNEYLIRRPVKALQKQDSRKYRVALKLPLGGCRPYVRGHYSGRDRREITRRCEPRWWAFPAPMRLRQTLHLGASVLPAALPAWCVRNRVRETKARAGLYAWKASFIFISISIISAIPRLFFTNHFCYFESPSLPQTPLPHTI